MSTVFKILLVSCLLSLVSFSAVAQTADDQARIEQLRKQIEELEKEAAKYKGNIASEQAKAKTLQGEINILENQIKRIQAQINLTNTKISKTSIDIGNKENSIYDKEAQINVKKEAISEMMVSIQRRDNETLLSMLLKNENISDFFSEAQYSANINNSLVGLITELKNVKSNLEHEKTDLESAKTELEKLNRQNKVEQLSLAEVKSGKNNILKVTKGQEAQYKKILTDIEHRKSLFFTELKELETRIIQGGLYLVHIKAASVPKKGTKLFRWPEDDYRITQGYGYTAYARRGAYGGAAHNGIDLAGGFGSQIMAIGDGEIVANGKNDGWGNWVAIKHDNDLVSVYGHMSALSFLRVGTRVKTGEVIGFEGSTGNSTGSHLHLSLYKEFFTYVNEKKEQLYFNYFEGSLNPSDYLY